MKVDQAVSVTTFDQDSAASCAECEICIDQPPEWEHTTPDGVFIKQMFLKDSGTMIPQHAHAYDHTSMLAKGRILAWCADEPMGEFQAPAPIFIKARVKHTFKSLEPETLIYCIHKQTPVIVEEHQFDAHSIARRQI